MHAANDPPSLRCISVLSNGNVQLTWVVPNDPNGFFDSYHIYYSANGISFQEIDSIFSYATTTFVHSGTNANTSIRYYYLLTRYDDGTAVSYSSPTDTMQTILPIVINTTPFEDGYANVSWNPIYSPELSTSLGWYYIYKRIPPGNWTLVDSTQFGNESYIDDEKVCQDSIYFRIEIGDSAGCVSVSAVTGELIEDQSAPANPTIDSVSIDTATGNAYISWQTSPSGDTKGYFIILNGSTIDTLWGAGNTFYINTNSNSNNQSEQYSLAVFDSCFGVSGPWGNTSASGIIHNTIYLQATVGQCDRQVSLSWNAYVQWPQGVENYLVFSSENNAPFTLLTTIPATQTSYAHTGLTPGSSYCYVVRANEKSGSATSTSNKLCITMFVTPPPQFNYLASVSVEGQNQVEVKCYVDTSAIVSSYNIWRSDDGNNYQKVGNEPPSSNPIFTYVDQTAETSAKSHYYKVNVADICGDEIMSSNVSQTIFLSGSADNLTLVNTISWNAYTGWETVGSGIDYYNIYRSVNGIYDNSPLATASSSTFSFVDDVSAELQTNGEFCYYVEAVEATGNTYGFQETSKSNELCLQMQPVLWMPNVFTPNGDKLNDEFKPVVSFIASNGYSFAIYSRLGKRMFDTNDPQKGWDGDDAPIGVYVYDVYVQIDEDNAIRRKGSVTLIR